MAKCSFENCDQLPIYILWVYDYQTYCENHHLSVSKVNIYKLESISVENYPDDLFSWKLNNIWEKILDYFENSKNLLISKENDNENLLTLVNKLNEDYNNFLTNLNELTPSKSKTMIDATLYNLVYIEKNLPTELLRDQESINNEIEKFKLHSEEIMKYRNIISKTNSAKRLSLPRLTKDFNRKLKSESFPMFKVIELVYFDFRKEYRLNLCKILTYREKYYYLKKLEYSDESYKKILENEIQVISAPENKGIFVPISSKNHKSGVIRYRKAICEPSLASLLKTKDFKEKEIWDFISLIQKFLNSCFNKISGYILEPACISLFKGKFIIQDIFYSPSNSTFKYQSPEQKQDPSNFNPISSSIYSAGLIILEMLNFDISGFNSKLLNPILLNKIMTLKISDQLKNLLSQMLHYYRSKRLSLEAFNNVIVPNI